MSKRQVMLFNRFERFWHWSQMLLILLLLISGFNIHGFFQILSFENAVNIHTLAALALLLLWIFAIFWHLTTGTWRHYVPSSTGLKQVVYFYSYGIFMGENHPYKKTYGRKHNPLQALAYLALKLLLFPAIWISGIAYLSYAYWASGDSAGLLGLIANMHTAVAFAIVIFIIAHVYLLTTGHSFKQHLMPMVNGFDEVDLSKEQEAYLEKNEPGQIR